MHITEKQGEKVIIIQAPMLTDKATINVYFTLNFLQNHVTHNVTRLTPKKGKFPKIYNILYK